MRKRRLVFSDAAIADIRGRIPILITKQGVILNKAKDPVPAGVTNSLAGSSLR